MKTIRLSKLVSPSGDDGDVALRTFALLNIGIADSLDAGNLKTADAVALFFNAENCRFVRTKLHDKKADEIMSRGVQLHDLFEALPQREAKRELQHELHAIRTLCSRLLKSKPTRRVVKPTAAKQ